MVICHGHFNIIHPGHVRYLDYARQQGTKLIVSIQGDSSFLNSNRKHHFLQSERAAGVASLQTVDQVVLLGEGSLEDLIKVLNPEVLVLGKEFEYEQVDQVSEAVQLLKKQGGKILFHAGEFHYASVDLLRDNILDLSEAIRQTAAGAIPIAAVCRANCLGLCTTCASNRNISLCNCDEIVGDPRWQPLDVIGLHDRQ